MLPTALPGPMPVRVRLVRHRVVGPHLVEADVRLEPDAHTSVLIRGIRMRPSGDTNVLVMPGVRRQDGNHEPAIALPRPWRDAIVVALLAAAGDE